VTVVREGEGLSSMIAIEVSDTGPGIAKDDLPRVFDRFFTTRARAALERSSDRQSKGSGLGLALVKAVAEAHGGEVAARSTLGEGATFRVVLPAKS
jgi:signal transduction histidine kinase